MGSSGSHFVVSHGACKGAYDGVLLSTDLEPDDILAIKALAPCLHGVQLLVVVGEGPCDKSHMATQLLASFGIDDGAVVVQGASSSEGFPTDMLSAFAEVGTTSAATTHAEAGAAAAHDATRAFIERCEAPFLLLLKPPYELLGLPPTLLAKSKAALYGSFNLSMLRRSASEAGADQLAKFVQEERQLFESLGALLWVERSLSVGRDSVLEPTLHPELWAALERDRSLIASIHAWNGSTIRRQAPKIEGIAREMSELLAHADQSGAGTPFAAFGQKASEIDKKVKMLLSITKCDGLQVCHADTVVIAALLDESGEIARYERRCATNLDPSLGRAEPDLSSQAAAGSSNVSALVASEGDERKRLERATYRVLVDALGADANVKRRRAE